MLGMAGDNKLLLWLLLLSSSSARFGADSELDDISCLKTVKQSVIDPLGILQSSWNFDSTSNGFICRFTGVECWYHDKNLVYSLSPGSLRLEGQFPRGLEYCTSMVRLDLSINNFSGPIPSDIAQRLPQVTILDLSGNKFSGEIPVGISDLSRMTVLNLQHNQLDGQIPEQLGVLGLLTSFSVADNLLSGRIPSALQNYPASTFAGNQELCGAPLDSFPGKRKTWLNNESTIGMAAGFVVGFVVAFYFPHCIICSQRMRPYIFPIC